MIIENVYDIVPEYPEYIHIADQMPPVRMEKAGGDQLVATGQSEGLFGYFSKHVDERFDHIRRHTSLQSEDAKIDGYDSQQQGRESFPGIEHLHRQLGEQAEQVDGNADRRLFGGLFVVERLVVFECGIICFEPGFGRRKERSWPQGRWLASERIRFYQPDLSEFAFVQPEPFAGRTVVDRYGEAACPVLQSGHEFPAYRTGEFGGSQVHVAHEGVVVVMGTQYSL